MYDFWFHQNVKDEKYTIQNKNHIIFWYLKLLKTRFLSIKVLYTISYTMIHGYYIWLNKI